MPRHLLGSFTNISTRVKSACEISSNHVRPKAAGAPQGAPACKPDFDLIIIRDRNVFAALEVFEIEQDLDELVDTLKRVAKSTKPLRD